MRDLLQRSLGRTLSNTPVADRLAAAWPVVAGPVLGRHSRVAGVAGSTVTVAVDDAWRQELARMTPQLRAELAAVSGVPVTAILFVSPGEAAKRAGDPG